MELPLYEQIYAHILQQIQTGVLKPGDPLPSEMQLAEQFNVSRITSKKAMETLSREQWIERVRGKGSYVASTLPEQHAPHANRTLTVTKRKLVGVILPDFSESYGAKLIRALEDSLSEQGCDMLMKFTHDSVVEEKEAIRALILRGIDGLIVYPVHGEHYNEELLRLILDGFPVVLTDRYLKGIPAPAVFTDNKKAAVDLMNFLFERGHRHIAFLSAPAENTSTLEDRLAGCRQALLMQGLPLLQNYELTEIRSTLPKSLHSNQIRSDHESILRFLQKNSQITAFMATEYNIALVMKYLLQMHQELKGKYEITCFDSPLLPFEEPEFTYIEQDEAAMGMLAVQLLQRQWDGAAAEIHHHTVPYRLVRK